MRAFWEKINRFGGAEGVAFFREQLHVAGEGGRVAGDVDDALRLHGGDGLDHVGAYALARRVDDDHVGLFAALEGGQCEFLCEYQDEIDGVYHGLFEKRI